jgi:formyl-CoA transferase
MGGLMWITGLPGQGPVRAGAAVADIGAGMHCAIGCLIALLEREVSGEGQWISTSLLQAMISMCDFQAARWTVDRQVPGQAGNNHPTAMPMGAFTCADGYVNIAASGSRMWRKLCETIGAREMEDDPRFADDAGRHANREALTAALNAQVSRFTCAELVEMLNAAGVPAGPVYKMDQVFADPQVKHLRMAQPVHSPVLGDIELVGQAIGLSRAPLEIRAPAPELGEHTDEVLQEIGYADADIARLRRLGVV